MSRFSWLIALCLAFLLAFLSIVPRPGEAFAAPAAPLRLKPAEDPVCHPSQTIFDFPEVMQGLVSQGTMWLTNNSDQPLPIFTSLESDVFHVGHLGRDLEPWETVSLNIWFAPDGGGVFESVLDLGNEICPQILLRGTGLARSCAQSTDHLDFGDLNLGDSGQGTFTLTNDGDVVITVEPTCLVPGVSILGLAGDLPPGESRTFEVAFTPIEPGIFQGVISWNSWYCPCAEIGLSASVGVDMEPGEDRLGIFFDEAFTELMPDVGAAGQVVPGYLVLTQPSALSGVSAWECQVVAEAPGYILSWEFAGQALNAGQGNNLVVGLGGEPLPWAENILLGTFQMYVAEEALDPFGIRVLPVVPPTIPGTMAYIPGAPGAEPRPMLPFTGVETVAWVTAGGTSTAPLPESGRRLSLPGNVPNPFNPSTEIRFEVDRESFIELAVYDMQGRRLRTLVHEWRPAGNHGVRWDGRDQHGRPVASGTYHVRLKAGERSLVRKILLLK